MKFSVIIPTYNRARLIKETISSLLDQSFKDFEVIVVDDGSTDDTRAVVQELKDPRVVYLYKKNGERGAARNYGAQNAKGEYLNFFDSDDTAYDDHLSVANEFITVNNLPKWFHVGYRIVDGNDHVVLEETNFKYDVAKRLIDTNFLGCNSVFIRKDLFLNNLFNEDRRLASSEDWEIWLRIISRYDILSCDAITFQINNHEGRSLFTIPPEKIETRDLLMVELLLKDELFVRKFKKDLPMFIADRYTFFALVFSLSKRQRVRVLMYLVKAFFRTPLVLGKRRFWAALKYFI